MICYSIKAFSVWELSSVGRATALQAVGHRFEPCSSHHKQCVKIVLREWLSGRASPCQGECRGFESRLPLQKFFRTVFLWRYSQVVRPGSAKPSSPGSNPGGASKNTIYCVLINPVSTRYGVDFCVFGTFWGVKWGVIQVASYIFYVFLFLRNNKPNFFHFF